MIKRIQIENYKSIRKLDLELGRLNVFIGENGCGKTNILEAIALGSAAAQDKLDNEFLAARGIRVTAPQLMRAAFGADTTPDILIEFQLASGTSLALSARAWEQDGSVKWVNNSPGGVSQRMWRDLALRLEELNSKLKELDPEALRRDTGLFAALADNIRAATPVQRQIRELDDLARAMPEFILFAPENTFLRRLEEEGQVLPLGVKGEGLLAHLQALVTHANASVIAELNEQLSLLDWFEALQVPDKDQAGRALRIRDRYLPEGVVFDQRSANEGFLFLLFYFTLFASPQTPRFFAIDNVDASLNPKMCAALMASMVKLAKSHDKQAIVTTHNPSLLDGLDLTDDEQRLFVVSRRSDGSTRINRVAAPKPLDGDAPVRLSDAFVRGYIGGLPDNF